MVVPRRLIALIGAALCTVSPLLSACVEEASGPSTTVALVPTTSRPPLDAATAAPAPTGVAIATPLPAVSPSPAVGGRTYVVREGDSLSTIAGAVYGDAGAWRPIFEANRDQMSSESQLQIGQTLRIP